MENIKIIASQTRSIYQYKSVRNKILKCNADILFNKQCLTIFCTLHIQLFVDLMMVE